jgi:hypothetical protein
VEFGLEGALGSSFHHQGEWDLVSFGGIVGAVARYDLAECGIASQQPEGPLVVDTNAGTEFASADARGRKKGAANPLPRPTIPADGGQRSAPPLTGRQARLG